MNPEPVIVTGVSAEPATVDDGVTAVMAGRGFDVGGGFVAVPPPPQPIIIPIPKIKISDFTCTRNFRSISGLHKLKASIQGKFPSLAVCLAPFHEQSIASN